MGMARCDRAAAGFWLWPVFSAAALRRRLLEAVTCGVSSHRKKAGFAAFSSPERRPRPEESRRGNRSERLSELLKAEASEWGLDETESKTRRKIETLEELQNVVKRLQGGLNDGRDQRKDAAMEVRRLAKNDPSARETLAMLGAIPPLVGILDSDNAELHIASLYALLNLGIGNEMNKAAILKAGAVHKMLKLIEFSSDSSVSEAIVANFLGLSALDANKPIIGSSGAIPFLVKSFQNPNPSPSQARQDALRALLNLSISQSNIPHLVESGLVHCLLAAIGDMEVSERALAILSNLVSAPEARRAMNGAPDAFPTLVDVLNWSDSPGCQEKSAYVLMVMAHKGYGDRAAMIEAGITSALLELTLVGTALAQKRASRILQILRVGKGKQVSDGFSSSVVPAISAPQCGAGREWEEGEEGEAGISEERRAVRRLVQQSLQSNMRRIVRRANLPQDLAPSDRFSALATGSTSKSLPF